MRKLILTTGLFIVAAAMLLLSGCGCQTADTVKYEGDRYVCLEYPANIFYYDYNGNSHDNFEEVDGIYPIDSHQWNMIWNGGDLYCIKDHADEAVRYYADDENYDWYISIDEEDESALYPIEVTAAETEGLYAVDEKEKNLAVYFNELEKQGSIIKISKDGIVRGTTSIGKYNNEWYWRSETIDENRECEGTWPEYIQLLPESLDSKIKHIER